MYDHIARYYDLSHDDLIDDIPFMLSQAAETGGPVLEVGCGSGRLLVPLAGAGYDVIGVDDSPEMLARAEVRLSAQPPGVRERVRFIRADVRALDLSSQNGFSLVLFGNNTFMHLDEAGAGASLKRLRPLLLPGGRLLIDVMNPLILAAAGDDPDFVLEDTLVDARAGETIRQYTAYESVPGEQAVDVSWVYETEGGGSAENERTPTRARLRYHYLYPHQYDLLMGLTDFRLSALLGDYDGSAFDEDSERLILIATAER